MELIGEYLFYLFIVVFLWSFWRIPLSRHSSFESPFSVNARRYGIDGMIGGKLDDVTVVVGRVTATRPVPRRSSGALLVILSSIFSFLSFLSYLSYLILILFFSSLFFLFQALGAAGSSGGVLQVVEQAEFWTLGSIGLVGLLFCAWRRTRRAGRSNKHWRPIFVPPSGSAMLKNGERGRKREILLSFLCLCKGKRKVLFDFIRKWSIHRLHSERIWISNTRARVPKQNRTQRNQTIDFFLWKENVRRIFYFLSFLFFFFFFFLLLCVIYILGDFFCCEFWIFALLQHPHW